jgi:hypothetical protein
VAGEAEVVVGAEHDDALAIDDRLGALVAFERLVERVEAELLGHFDERKDLRLGKYVATVRVVVKVWGEGVYVNGIRNAVIELGSNF